MAAGEDWTRDEVEAAVADYLDMFMAELAGREYSKADHSRKLQGMLPGRSKGSIEFKHQNISAALLELGFPYIEGYKPARNYQELLEDVVAGQVMDNAALGLLMQDAVAEDGQGHAGSTATSLLEALTDPPVYERKPTLVRERRKPRPRLGINWLEVEAKRRASGDAGEAWALRYEEERLMVAGQPHLARRIEHKSRTEGDGLGYDILSFETNGRERLIEVKTTKFGIYTPFFASANEVETSAERHDHYHLYRLYTFTRAPKLYTIRGSLRESCRLDPVVYQARVLSR